jgi:hypothetical protein
MNNIGRTHNWIHMYNVSESFRQMTLLVVVKVTVDIGFSGSRFSKMVLACGKWRSENRPEFVSLYRGYVILKNQFCCWCNELLLFHASGCDAVGGKCWKSPYSSDLRLVYFFVVSWGGVRLSPLGTSATNWPIVPAPDCRRWMWSRWNGKWQGKPKYSEETCLNASLSTTNPTWPDLGWKPATNRMSYGTTLWPPFLWALKTAALYRAIRVNCKMFCDAFQSNISLQTFRTNV